MKVLKFSYIDRNDESNPFYKQWSRNYEYDLVFKRLETLDLTGPTIHNTACWWWECHNLFSRWLEQFGNVLNSDNNSRPLENKPNNFIIQDITLPNILKNDITICVSTLEHLDPRDWIPTLQNLLNATERYLILTFDTPPLNIALIEEFLWVKCEDVKERLTPQNSKYKHPTWDGINVVYLIIEK